MSYSSQQSRTSRSRYEGSDGGGASRTRSSLPSTPRAAPQAASLPRAGRDGPPSLRSLSGSTATSSSSSTQMSFLERMKAPSSRTSLEDNYAEPPKRRERNERNKSTERTERYERSERNKSTERTERYRSERSERSERYDRSDRSDRTARSRARSRTRPQSPVDEYNDYNRTETEPNESLAEGHGYDIWSRVTEVASKLTINVTQAWQKNIALADGEVTPPGEESRLTKAMKAYHLAKANSPTDLPGWLFTEQERSIGSRGWARSQSNDYEDQFLPTEREPPRPKGSLRDIYDSVSAPNGLSATRTVPVSDGSGSRAIDRLRAIREAKRSAVQTSTRGGIDNGPGTSQSVPPRTRTAPPTRGGLPSRPRRS